MSRNKRIALRGCLMALALVLSYLESLVPVFWAVPGIRLGIANIVTVYLLYTLGPADACFVTAGRLILSMLLFGNVTTLIYSLAGAVCSITVMLIARGLPFFSAMGVSILGGVFHNIGQTVAAAFLLSSGNILLILAVLLPVGAVAGAVIGFLSGILIRRVPLEEEAEDEEDEEDESDGA